MVETRLRSYEDLGSGGVAVGVICANENDPRSDEKAYDLRSRIYTCYVLCTSMLCLVPIVPYYVSKELYKRGHKKGAAISMEIFKYSHCMLVFTLVFTKVILFLLKIRPALLDNFFVKNQDLAVIVAAVLCATPVFCFVIAVRYYSVYDEVKTTGCSVVDALLAKSYLSDLLEGVPALICYTGSKGPLYTTESMPYRKQYGADIAYDIFIYSTSYLLVLPSCFALLCKLFLKKRKRTAFSVSRFLGVSAHVLLSNTIVIYAITLMLDRFLSGTTSVVRLRADSASMALLSGVFISSFILFVAVAFCYYEMNDHIYDSSREISDNIARSVLRFGLLTVAVSCVCDPFRTRAKLLSKGWECEKKRFAYSVFRRVISAVLLVPAVFWKISCALRASGKTKTSAIAKRAWVYSEIFLDNFVVFTSVFFGVCSTLLKEQVHAYSAGRSSALVGLVCSTCFLLVAAVQDFIEISNRVHFGSKARRWEDVIMSDNELETRITSMGALHLVASYIIHAADSLLGKKVHKSAVLKEDVPQNYETFSTRAFVHPSVSSFCSDENTTGVPGAPKHCAATRVML